jgi:hypothetical protein
VLCGANNELKLVLTLPALDRTGKVINRMPSFEIDGSELDPVALAALCAALTHRHKYKS